MGSLPNKCLSSLCLLLTEINGSNGLIPYSAELNRGTLWADDRPDHPEYQQGRRLQDRRSTAFAFPSVLLMDAPDSERRTRNLSQHVDGDDRVDSNEYMYIDFFLLYGGIRYRTSNFSPMSKTDHTLFRSTKTPSLRT